MCIRDRAKVRLWKAEEDPKAANDALWTLRTALTEGLKLLHPYMPFITCLLYTSRDLRRLSSRRPDLQKERLSLRVPEVSLQPCRHSMSRHKLQEHIPRKTWRLWQHRFLLIRSRWTVRQPSWKHPETRSQQREVNWRVV